MAKYKLIYEKEIEAPKKLIIGDPWYFENNEGDELVCVWKRIMYTDDVKAVVRVFEEEYNGFVYHIVRIYAMAEKALSSILKAEANNEYEFTFFDGSEIKYKPITLGCDTARFEIETDKGYAEIHTGADGYYGTAIKYKHKMGIQVELNVDSDVCDWKEIVSVFLGNQ